MNRGRPIEAFRSGHACPEPRTLSTPVATSIRAVVITSFGPGHACPERMIEIRRAERTVATLAS